MKIPSREGQEKGIQGVLPPPGPVRTGFRWTWRRGWLEAGRKSLQGTPGLADLMGPRAHSPEMFPAMCTPMVTPKPKPKLTPRKLPNLPPRTIWATEPRPNTCKGGPLKGLPAQKPRPHRRAQAQIGLLTPMSQATMNCPGRPSAMPSSSTSFPP